MNLIIELLFDIAGEIIGHFLPDLSPKTKYEKNMIRLKEEPWFAALLEDYRYEYIIQQNSKVRRFLKNEKNVKMIISMDDERERFISLVKEEHAKFTKVR